MSTYYPLRTFTLIAPRRILFGIGVVEKVGEEARQLGGGRALIVTDEVVEKIGLVKRVRELLKEEGLKTTTFNKVRPEPKMEVANAVAKAARAAEYDMIVGLGGGSSLDMAKVASIMTANPGKPSEYLGVNLVQEHGPPLIAIPTTSGTGSEATSTVVVIHEGRKNGITSPLVMPEVAVVDPTMTKTMPPRVTANTGLDALSHSVEAYMSVDASPFTDALALKAIELIANNLPIAYSQGGNIEARYNMSLAALLAGLAITNAGTCGGHATAYGYAVRYQLAHGYACAMALPYIMDFNAMACLPKMAKVAIAMGENVSGMSLWDAASLAVSSVKRLNESLGVPLSLRELGVSREEIPAIAEDMLRVGRLLVHNPRAISKEDAVEIFERMYEERFS
jgi:alcohol dehydrogenase class IV